MNRFSLATLHILLLCACHTFLVTALSSNRQLKIAFVTGNKMKAREVEQILREENVMMSHHNDNDNSTSTSASSLIDFRIVEVDLPEIQEVDTLAIAKNKAILATQLTNSPCVVEDTSLKIHSLGGMPGPYVKWFMQKLGCDDLYKILFAYEDKSATACCSLAFCPYPHADPVTFTGETVGTLCEPNLDAKGWDSMFIPNNQTLSFSDMNTIQKNKVSHRGKAVRKWARWLIENQDELWERQNGRPSIGHKGLDFKIQYAEE